MPVPDKQTLKSLDDLAREMMEEYYRDEINVTMPEEIKITKRMMRKHPNLKDQSMRYIQTCQSWILECKNSLKLSKEQR